MNETELTREYAAFLRQRAVLRHTHGSKWVVFLNQELCGVFDDFEAAAIFANREFHGEPFLIRNITAEDEQVPLLFADA